MQAFKSKYHYYLRKSTKTAINSFERMLPKMGKIIKVRGTYTLKRWYRVTFYTETGKQFQWYGFAWFYGGEGPRGLIHVLRLIGAPEAFVSQLQEYKYHGNNSCPNSWQINL